MFSSWDERRFMGAVLCIITKSVSYRLHRLCSCYGHMPEACSGCNPTVNKPKLSISSLDIISKLKTTLTTSQTLKFNGKEFVCRMVDEGVRLM